MPFNLMTKMFLTTTLDFDRHNCILPTFVTTLLLVFYAYCFKNAWRSIHGGRDSSVGIAIPHGLDSPGFMSPWDFRTRPDRPRGLPCSLYNGYRVTYPGIKQPGRGVGHYPGCVPGCAEKSLARSTSRCRRTESIVSLERGGLFMCRIASLFLLQRLKEACQATRAISTTSIREMSWSFFFLQGKAPREIHAILTEKLGEHAPSYDTVKNWVTQVKEVIFLPVMRLVLDDSKQWPRRRL